MVPVQDDANRSHGQMGLDLFENEGLVVVAQAVLFALTQKAGHDSGPPDLVFCEKCELLRLRLDEAIDFDE